MKELPSAVKNLVGLESWDILPYFNSDRFIFLPEEILNILEQEEIESYNS